MKSEKKLEEGYREMASDRERERGTEEWCEALIGDSSQTAREWFRKLDELNSEPFPSRRQPATPKRDVFQ